MTPSTSFAVASLLASYLTAFTAQSATLVVSNPMPPNHVFSTQGFEPLMACIKSETHGSVDFSYFPGGQLAPLSGSIGALNSELADLALVSPTNESNKLPLTGLTMMPGMGSTATEMVQAYRKVLDAGGPLSDELAANKVRALTVNMNAVYQIMSSTTPIDSLEKFQGRKVRSAGGAMTFTVEAVGGVPVEMTAGDLYIAMQNGTVDSTVLSFASVKTYSLQELLKSVSGNGSFGTSVQLYGISESGWNKLDADEKKAVDGCGRRVERDMAKYLDDQNEALKNEFASGGIKVVDFTEAQKTEISKQLDKVALDYIARLAARGLPAQKAYDQLRAALGD